VAPIARLSALLLAAAVLGAHAADDFGTLFTTPEERARLDKLRRGEPPPPPASAQALQGTRRPTVNGYVQRSDGRNTVWIDGRPVVVATPNANGIFDPRVVQPLPRRAPPPEAEEPAEEGKDAKAPKKDDDAKAPKKD
jgi:hypothetical protein